MRNQITYITVKDADPSRPKERPPKSNWKVELLKKGLGVLQHVSPRKTTEIVWHHFTKPARSRYTSKQQHLVDQASISSLSYLGYDIKTYTWGNSDRRILLSHGWNSKVADFRRMIESLVDQGFQVEGIDMKAHGKSDGRHTALPEIRDILKNYYMQHGPFETVIGYSIGGIAAGIMLSELSGQFQPKNFFIVAAPSYVRYFFHDVIVRDLGYKDAIYEIMCDMVQERYHQSIDYFDLRTKQKELSGMRIHLIYDEDDATVPFQRGIELHESFPSASFVHSRGLGHYQVIAHPEIIGYITNHQN